MQRSVADIRIGISGWLYPRWRGTFYPPGLRQRQELHYAASKFNSVEVNGTFYSMKKPADFAAWRDQVPDDFLFALKGPRFITHMKKLKDVEAATANFFASGVLRLNQQLGPLLWQLPPQLSYSRERMESFLNLLPRTTREAARLGQRHNDKLKAEPWLRVDAVRPLRHAFEVRHESFLCGDFFKLLREHNAALVIPDTAGKFCYSEELTADFVYIRLHGSTELYTSGYSDQELASWAAKIQSWSRRPARDVFVYFDNDAKVHAPFDALRLAELLKPEHGNDLLLESPQAGSWSERPRKDGRRSARFVGATRAVVLQGITRVRQRSVIGQALTGKTD